MFINAGCRFQDQGGIYIGDGALIGHNCVIATLNHDMDPAMRANLLPTPVRIGAGPGLGNAVEARFGREGYRAALGGGDGSRRRARHQEKPVQLVVSPVNLANCYKPIMGYGLSYMIKKRLDEYYKGFTSCEGKIGMGDLTPFVIIFSRLVSEAAERIVSLLSEGRDNLFKCESAAVRISDMADSKNLSGITSILIQATLFSDYGVTMSGLAETLQTSKQTPYRHLKVLGGMGLVEKKKIGNEAFHTINLERLLELSDAQH